MYDSDSEIDSDIENLLYSQLHYSAEINLDSDSELKVEVDNTPIEAEDTLESIEASKEKEVTIKDDIWAIDEKDRQGAAEYLRSFSKAKRYYIDQRDSGVQCHNCNDRGHISRDCPEPKKETCHLCGSSGHVRWNCPNDLCYNCYEIGHVAKACKAPRKSYYAVCKRCWGRGHHKNSCPEIWRQYHLTIKENVSLKEAKIGKNGEILTMRKIRYCYNCGYEGHFGHDCTEQRPNRRPVSAPFVVHYDKCPFKAKSRNEKQHGRKGADRPPDDRSRSEKNRSDEFGQADSSAGTMKGKAQETTSKKKRERNKKKLQSKDQILDEDISLDIGRYSRTKIHEDLIVDISSPDNGFSEDEKVVEGQKVVLEALGKIWHGASGTESQHTGDQMKRSNVSVEQNEKDESIEKHFSAAKANSSDKQRNAERQNTPEKPVQTEKQSSAEEQNSVDKQSKVDKRNPLEKRAPAEVRKSKEKRSATKKEDVIVISSDAGEDNSKDAKEVVKIRRNKTAVTKSYEARNTESVDVDNRKRKWRASAVDVNENSSRKVAKRSEGTKEQEITGNKDTEKSFDVVSSNESMVEYVDIDVYASNSDMEHEIDENNKKIKENSDETRSDRGKRKADSGAADMATSSLEKGSKRPKIEKQRGKKEEERLMGRARNQRAVKEDRHGRKEKRPSEKNADESTLKAEKDTNNRTKTGRMRAAGNPPERPANNTASSTELRRKMWEEESAKKSNTKFENWLIDSSHFLDKSRSKVERSSRNFSKEDLKEKCSIGNANEGIINCDLNDDFVNVGNYGAKVPRIVGGSRYHGKEVIRGDRSGVDLVEGDGSHVVFVDGESDSSDDGENFQFSNLLMNQESPDSSDQEFYDDDDGDEDDDDDDLRKTIDTLKAKRHDRRSSNQRNLDQVYDNDHDARDFLSLSAERETAEDDVNREDYPRKVDLTRYNPNISNEEDLINYGLANHLVTGRHPTNPQRLPPDPERRPASPERRLTNPIRKSASNSKRQPPNLKRNSPMHERQYADDLDRKIVTIRRSINTKRQAASPERRSSNLERQLFDPEGPPVNPERLASIHDGWYADNSARAKIDGERLFDDLETRREKADAEKVKGNKEFCQRVMNDLHRLQTRRSLVEQQTTSTPTLQTQNKNASTLRNVAGSRGPMDQTDEQMDHDMNYLYGVEIKMAQWFQDKTQHLKRKKRNSFKALLKKSLRQHGEIECPKTQASLERLILKWKHEDSQATKRQTRSKKKTLKTNQRKVSGFASRQSSKSKYPSKGAGRGRKQTKEDFGVKRSVRGFRSSKVAEDFMSGGFL